MEQILVKRANNSEYLLEDKNKGSFISSIIQSTELRSNDVINIELSSREFINFTIGDSFHYLGQKYTLNQIPRYFKNSSNDFQFSITFEGVMFDLRRASYDVNIDTTGSTVYGETLTADLELFAKILIENINRVFPDKWILGELPEATETKTITFSEEENCLAALQMFCDEYDTDFVIKTNNSGVNILNFKQVGNEIPLEFKVGFQKGLYNLTREKVDASDIVTRLKVYGADKNLGTDYRANRLVLKDKNKSNSYIENDQAVAKYGIYESTKIFDDIYPRRNGKVTAINSESVYKFSDSSMDFDLKEKDENGTKYLLNGINAKIHFNTGDLAGYEFEIHDYNHETKEFHIIKFADENSYEFPSKDNDAFRISVGDEYVILDIQMPQSYIDNAEAELLDNADEYLSDKLEPNIQYLLDVDTLHLQRILNDTVTQYFSIGDFIKVVDEDFDINRYIRIKSIERDLRNPFDYKLTLSDSKVTNFLSGTIPGEINTIKNIIKINNLNNPAKARRNWKDAQEVLNMVFDVEGDYYTDKIKPNSIETTHLQVGAKSMQFNLIDSFFEPNFEGNPNKIRWSTCKLVHFTISDKIVDWQIQGGQKDLEANKPYYLYAKCNKVNNIGVIEITEAQYMADQGNYYYFLIGIVNTYSEDVKAREISLMYGFTTVSGRFIKTGRISSNDGSTYIDLDENIFKGRIEFTNDSPAYSQIQVNIDKSKTDSITASKAYSDAQDELKRIQTEAYADGKVTAAEQRAIDDATAKAEAAKLYAAAQDHLLRVQLEAYADGVITAEEQERIQQMQDNLAAAKAYADAQANLAKIAALAYADGVIDEEEARAIADATAKMEAAKQHAQSLVNNIQIGGRNLFLNSKGRMPSGWGNGQVVKTSEGINFQNCTSYIVYGGVISQSLQIGEEYTISIMYRSENTPATNFSWYLNDDNHYKSIISPDTVGQWKVISDTRRIETNGNVNLHMYVPQGTITVAWIVITKGNKGVQDWIPAIEDMETSILQSKNDSISASKAYSDAQDELKKIQTEAYADGKVTAAEQRAIDDATSKAEAAKIYSVAQDNLLRVQLEAYADGQITAEEQERIQQMQDNLAAAKAYADAQANLAKIAALAYADGVIDEEEARAIADATAKMELAKQHAQGLVNSLQIGGRNLFLNSKGRMPSGWGNGQVVKTSEGINFQNCTSYIAYPGVISQSLQIGEEYTISIMYRSENTPATNFSWHLNDDNSYKVIQSPDTVGEWKVISDTRRIETNGNVNLHMYVPQGTITVAWIVITKGNKGVQDWTPAPEDMENAINDVKIKAENALTQLTSIANDNILSPSEKQQVSNEWNRIKSEYTSNYSLAINNGISTTEYVNSYNDLYNYITPLLVNVAIDSPIVGDIFRTNFKNYYDRNVELLVAISNKFKSGIDKNTTDLINANNAIDRVNKITSFLGTTVDNNVVATGLLMVGSGSQSNAGISGLNEAGAKSVRLWAGGTAQNRNKARWQMLDNGMEVGYHSNGILANERGYNGTSWVFNLYNEQGQKTFSLDSERGLVPVPYIPESYTLINTLFLINTSENASDSELDSILRTRLYKNVIYQEGVYKANIFLEQNKDIYEYFNGTKPENASKEQYNGYKESDNYMINSQNGWYILNQSLLGVTGAQQNINLYFYLQFLQDGKVKSTKSLNINVNEVTIIAI